MHTFPAQVKTADHDLDVEITLSSDRVAIIAGDEALGLWKTRDCNFQRTAPTTYRFHTESDRDWVTIEVPDDAGFRQALDLLRQERVPLIPRSLAWMGIAAVAAAVAFTTLTTSEAPAQAEPQPTTTAATEPLAVTVSTAIDASPVLRNGAAALVGRWNDIARNSPLALSSSGRTNLGRGLEISIEDASIIVDATLRDDTDQAREIMMALGLTIAAMDPEAGPGDRADILAALGIDVDGANTTAIDAAVTNSGIEYHLIYDPGATLRLSARVQ